jgi:hypothetical protein
MTLALAGLHASAARAQTETAAIEPGQTLAGTFTSDSPILPERNAYHARYTFQGEAGQRVELRVNSDMIDTYGILLGPAGHEVARDDDGGGSLDARIVLTLEATGTYTLIATTFGSLNEGDYTVSLRELVYRPPVIERMSIGDERTFPFDPANASDTFYNGQGLVVEFEPPIGEFIEAVVGTVSEAGMSVRLLAPNGEIATEDYTSMYERVPANLRVLVTQPGRWRLVTSEAGGVPGEVTVVLRRSPGTGSPDVAVQGELQIGASFSDTLGSQDPLSLRQVSARRYRLVAPADGRLQINMESADFDTYLAVYAANGLSITENDDSNDSLNSQVRFQVTAGTEYVVEASSYGPGASGGFTLRGQMVEPSPGVPRALTVGQTVDSAIDRSDSERADGGFQEAWTFQGRAGQNMVAILDAQDGLALSVVSPMGELLMNHAGTATPYPAYYEEHGHYHDEPWSSGPGMGSWQGVLPDDGTYIVNVTGSVWGSPIPYQLAVEETRPLEATALRRGRAVRGTVDRSAAYSAVWNARTVRYSLESAQASPWRIEVTGDSLSGLRLAALLQTGEPLGQVQCLDEAGSCVLQTVLPAGTHFIDIAAASPGAGVPFTLRAEPSDQVPTPTQAIQPGTPVEGTVELGRSLTAPQLHSAFFVYEVPDGPGRTLRIEPLDDAGYNVSVSDAMGEWIGHGDTFGTTVSLPRVQNGRYFLSVQSMDNRPGRFRLTIE